MTNKLDINALPCGHHASLGIKNIESNVVFCELCEVRSELRDALTMERDLTADREALTAKLAEAERERDEAITNRENDREALRSDLVEVGLEYASLRSRVEALESALRQIDEMRSICRSADHFECAEAFGKCLQIARATLEAKP